MFVLVWVYKYVYTCTYKMYWSLKFIYISYFIGGILLGFWCPFIQGSAKGLKRYTVHSICRAAMEMQTYRTDLWTQGGRRGWDEWREWHGNICMTICKTDSQRELAVWLRSSNPVLCDSLEGWNGVVQEGGEIYIHMTDSCWCMTETNTLL